MGGIKNGKVVYCDKEDCKGPIKPNIVFFGEGLPKRFMNVYEEIKEECDLLIVMGTGLAVSPFNGMVDTVGDSVPKVLINIENTAENGFDFASKYYPERLFLKGKSDDIVTKICKDVGWIDEFKGYTTKCKN